MILKPISDILEKSDEITELFSRIGSGDKISIEGISKSSFPLIISSMFCKSPAQTLVITKDSQSMHELYTDISCFVDPDSVFALPPWETLPYENVSPPESIERERITAIYKILEGSPAIIVTALESVIRLVPEKKFLLNKGVTLSANEEYPFDDILELLVSFGYRREYRVESFGQFSRKGGIIDIYPPSYQNPLRLDFFGDTLESIREFDIESQISFTRIDSVTIYPRRELILYKSERDTLTKKIGELEKEGIKISEKLTRLPDDGESATPINGIEDFFPLVIKAVSILSYFRDDARTIVIEPHELTGKRDYHEKIFSELYARKSADSYVLEPGRLLRPEILNELKSAAMELQVFTSKKDALRWRMRGITGFHGRIKSVREDIEKRLENGWRVLICTDFEGQARRLFDLLSEFNPDSAFDRFDPGSSLNILIAPLSAGFEIESLKILVLTDQEIFGKTYRKKRQFKKKASEAITSFLELKQGDYVVHINHGIGIFHGIERMSAGGVERDFLIIDYADGDKLYVSLDQIPMVQRYIGLDGKAPRLDSLGKKSAWNRIKERVRESIEETAKELIEIYSKRKTLKGFQFPPDTEWQEEFESKFEYEETSDQITAIEDVKDDMESPRPMERLICGDVGFGKTEVAIRAAFKAVMAGKQVAILVPTTVLAMQHFSTFKKRFYDYPIAIDMISRFRTRTEAIKIKEKLNTGGIDIIIGTHALLSKEISFKNLGLLVVDEEQRFGVKHKESLKKLRLLVDVLTLSATPIPRTLHMALAGIRELSTITTPPENRQSIDTYVLEENPDLTRMAILREIERGGQVFFVHNRVDTIDAVSESLKELVPEVTFRTAHGQMKEHELEDIIIDFINEKFSVLVCTTIIESGLDMPNVNTIIINRADTFGLSQLYQLKGRVGRSGRKAYAYLFYPSHMPLTDVAQKRLQVISEYSEIGSGFKIAMKDLEIRGSGNILGREQSGNIMEVGFDLYCQMLEDAVKKLKGEKLGSIFRTPVYFKTNFFLPESYIGDERNKIEFYKRFESCETISEVEILENELTDRFGPAPREVKTLIELEKIRALASSMEIDEIIEETRAIKIKLSADSKVDTGAIILQMQKKGKKITFDTSDKNIILYKPSENEVEKKLNELKKWLQTISLPNMQ
ncbi:MAG: transcription-repair coupling factor [Spirochaetes bacterium]|nr:transcription-repair coupling factor [Spirochaetota bacterium]